MTRLDGLCLLPNTGRRAVEVAAAAAKSKRLGVDDQRTMASRHRVSGFATDVVLLARKEL